MFSANCVQMSPSFAANSGSPEAIPSGNQNSASTNGRPAIANDDDDDDNNNNNNNNNNSNNNNNNNNNNHSSNMPIPLFFRRLSMPNSFRSMSIDDAEEYTLSVHRLITYSKWNRLRALLATEEGRNDARRAFDLEINNTKNTVNDIGILHEMIANDPPHDVVEKTFATIGMTALKQHLTNPLPSNYHRTPFHEAIQSCVSYDTIQLMVAICPAVVPLADERGITPLMIECSKGKYCDFDTVKLLVRSAPQHVMDEAADGSTALECALMSGAIDIFKRLQNFHAQELRKESHAEMERRRRRMAALVKIDAAGKDSGQSNDVATKLSSIEETEKLVRRHSSVCSRRVHHSSVRSQLLSRSSAAA